MEKEYIEKEYIENKETSSNYYKSQSNSRSIVVHPWRRYFARTLDSFLYSIILEILATNVLGMSNAFRSGAVYKILEFLIPILIMILLEPLLLNKLGTTPGKFVFGLVLRDKNGEKLSYKAGLKRTYYVIKYGLGFYIPFYSLYRLYKSYELCDDRSVLPWEDNFYNYGCDPTYKIKDTKGVRILAFFMVYILGFLIIYLSSMLSMSLPNKGDITVAEFAENYNESMEMVAPEYRFYLDENGNWAGLSNTEENVFELDGLLNNHLVDFTYRVENGYLTGVSTSFISEGGKIVSLPLDNLVFASLAFCGGQEGNDIFFSYIDEINDFFSNDPLTDFDSEISNLRLIYEVKSKGYNASDWTLFSTNFDNSEDNYYEMTFEIVK